MISVGDCINQERISLERYVQSKRDELLKTFMEDEVENQEAATIFKSGRRVRISRNGWKTITWKICKTGLRLE